jgi:hypothetical protein
MKFLDYLPGRAIEIYLPNNERHKGIFAITELDDLLASHNEYNFQPTVGYPVDENGQNINDRAYDRDPAAQAHVQYIAQNLIPERLINTSRDAEGSPIITKDGIVISGNNRTMSLKLAANEYPDKFKRYVDLLKEEIESFGISKDKLENDKFKKPVLVRIDFSIINPTTADLAKFNKDTKKSVRPVDRSIAMGKILMNNERCINIISEIVSKYETFSDFRANFSDEKKMRDALLGCDLIIQTELNNYWQENGFSDQGMELIESMIAGIVLSKDAILASEEPGVKRMRNIIVTSLPVLLKNKNLPPEYTLIPYINEAIILEDMMLKTGLSFTDYIAQLPLLYYERPSEKAVFMNRLLKKGRNTFKDTIERYNYSAENQTTSMLWDDKISSEEMFQAYIENSIYPEEREIIYKYYRQINQNNQKSKEDKILNLIGKIKKLISLLETNMENTPQLSYGTGGIVRGKRHVDGGEKFLIKNSDTIIELEDMEGVINRNSMLSKEKYALFGTPCEIASQLNQIGGGVKFNCP